MNEARGIGRRIGLEGDQVRGGVPLAEARRQLAQDGDEIRLGLGCHGPHDVGRVLVPLRQPFGPGARVIHRDGLAIALMKQGHGDVDALPAGGLEDGIDVLEVGLVGRERIIVEPRFLVIHIGLGAVTHSHEHDLDKHKALVFAPLDNECGLLERVVAEQLPLSGAQPENGRAALVHEIPPIGADLHGKHRFLGQAKRGADPHRECQTQEASERGRHFHAPVMPGWGTKIKALQYPLPLGGGAG